MSVRPEEHLFWEKKEKIILSGLAFEWETALWVLKQRERERMHKPFFRLTDMKTRLGSWCPQKREISLSRELALNHSWDAVREVLIHEMAHQFADEVLGACNEPPHGQTFQKACHLLRANPRASGSGTPLDERVLQRPRQEEGMAGRIRKLMALGKSQNLNEAESAMAKAHELMKKHNISLNHPPPRNSYVSVFLGKPKLRHQREEYCLANLLQDFYFVFAIWVPSYVLEKEKMGRVLEITGTILNVQTASYVFDFVHGYIHAQWNRYAGNRKLTHHRKTDFAAGIIEGFRAALTSKKHHDYKDGLERGLMKQGDCELARYAAYKYPHIVHFNRTASRHSAQVYEDGIAVGKQLVVAKGICEKTKEKAALTAP